MSGRERPPTSTKLDDDCAFDQAAEQLLDSWHLNAPAREQLRAQARRIVTARLARAEEPRRGRSGGRTAPSKKSAT